MVAREVEGSASSGRWRHAGGRGGGGGVSVLVEARRRTVALPAAVGVPGQMMMTGKGQN